MGQRCVRPGTGNGRERQFHQGAGVETEFFERNRCVNFRQAALMRFLCHEAEKARDSGTITQMCIAGALNLSVVFHRLHQADRVGAMVDMTAGIAEGINPTDRRCCIIKAQFFLLCA